VPQGLAEHGQLLRYAKTMEKILEKGAGYPQEEVVRVMKILQGKA
jgi:hypothetical protein